MSTSSEAVREVPLGSPPQSDDGEPINGSSEPQPKAAERRGDINKCPVCGSHIDSEAYYCAKCRNYFCFHCRARVLPSDPQLQCTNADCAYYGKLICEACHPHNERDEDPSVYAEQEDGYWPAWLVLVTLASAVVWYYASFLWALGTGIARTQAETTRPRRT